jgi:hypothetical protein
MFSTSYPSGVITSTASTYTPPMQTTPNDVANYLGRMDFTRMHSNNTDLWQRKNQAGYMTWEQAVAYCLVKPWLTEGEQ